MRILFVHYGPFLEPRGGGSKCDRQLVEILSAAGHECLVVIPDESEALGSPARSESRQVNSFTVVIVYELRSNGATHFRKEVVNLLKDFRPHCAVVTGTDRAHVILKTVLFSGVRTIYFPRCTWDLCWGPHVPLRNSASLHLLRACHKVYVHSTYMQQYIEHWFGVRAEKMKSPIPHVEKLIKLPNKLYWANRKFRCGMINPSLIKGIDILLQLMPVFPQMDFFAVPGWSTTSRDVGRLRENRNLVLLGGFDNPSEFYSDIDALLVPSLWDEAFGCVAVEAMSSGVPVLASDIGGLGEAKSGQPYLLPVCSITGYEYRIDERGIPVPKIPSQNIEPWVSALSELMTDWRRFETLSLASRDAAESYNASCSVEAIIIAARDWA